MPSSSSGFNWFKDILALIGGLGVLIVTISTLIIKLKNRSDKTVNKKIDDDRHFNDRLKTVEMTINNISDHSVELRTVLKELVLEVQNIRTKCVAHQQATLVSDIKQDLKRAADRLDNISDALRTSYVQTTVHYSDMNLINSAIDALRQQTTETNNNLLALLSKRPR